MTTINTYLLKRIKMLLSSIVSSCVFAWGIDIDCSNIGSSLVYLKVFMESMQWRMHPYYLWRIITWFQEHARYFKEVTIFWMNITIKMLERVHLNDVFELEKWTVIFLFPFSFFNVFRSVFIFDNWKFNYGLVP